MKPVITMNDSLSDADFTKLAAFIKERMGINLTPAKKVMLETRIRKRCLKLNILSFREYTSYILDKKNHIEELDYFIDLVTTNKTDFFRENHHFDFLISDVLPKLDSVRGRSLRFWSSACSKGAEPYTLAMVLEDYYANHQFGRKNEIIATDISLAILAEAKRAIYTKAEIDPVPYDMRKRYLLKSKNPKSSEIRIGPLIRSKIEFRRLNLTEAFGFENPFDVIFCRNVMIYFDRDTQTTLVKRMIKNLHIGGYLFMGHSELLDMKLYDNIICCSPSIYQRVK